MPVICAVKDCRRGIGIKFGPRTKEQMEIWKTSIDYNGKALSLNSFRICEFHFSKEQFKRDLYSELLGKPSRKRRNLLDNAIPNINLSEPSASKYPRLDDDAMMVNNNQPDVDANLKVHNIIIFFYLCLYLHFTAKLIIIHFFNVYYYVN